MATTFDVSTEQELRDAIFQISNDFADNGLVDGSTSTTGQTPPYTIRLLADITLTQSLPMIRGDDTNTITINGLSHTIDADNKGRVFFVESGTVEITAVTIDNAK